jgi:RimJ/RimL family protein N-acetyltransferase
LNAYNQRRGSPILQLPAVTGIAELGSDGVGRGQMLTGDRVLLRPIEKADLPRLRELIGDFEVSVLSSSGPIGPVSLAEFEARYVESEPGKKDEFFFAIEVDGELIGQAGLHHIVQFDRHCELGIGLGRDFWGKGFGQDTVRTLVDYAFEHLNMNRVELYVLADDHRAIGAYLKAGFVEEGRLRQKAWVRGGYHDELVMSVIREDWEPRI